MVLIILLSSLIFIDVSSAEAVFSSSGDCQDCATGSRIGNDPLNQKQKAPLEAITAFLAQQKKEADGTSQICKNTNGIFDLTIGNRQSKVKIEPLDKSILPLMPNYKNFKSVSRIGSPGGRGKSTLFGMLVENKDGWYIATLKDPKKIPYLTLYSEPGVLRAIEESISSGKPNPLLNLEKIEFTRDMVSGTAENGTVLKLDGVASVEDFTTSENRTVPNSAAYMDNHEIRVPPEMYQLLSDPEFKAARDKQNYGDVLDRIYQHALKVMKGDVFNATFVSLLLTDVRERGPCGAIYGKRGQQIVPPSIFDGERPSELQKNRLDAAQHFFGYALLSQMKGGSAASTISFLSKANMYYLNGGSNAIRRRHSGDGSEAGATKLEGGASPQFIGMTRAPQRTKIDHQIDLFYNDLGIEFGNKAYADKSVRPSHVINSPEKTPQKLRLGLKSHTEREWQAYDPNLEVPLVSSLDPAERDDRVPEFPPQLEWMNRADRKKIFGVFGRADPRGRAYGDADSGWVELAGRSIPEIRAYCAGEKTRYQNLSKTQKAIGEKMYFSNPCYDVGAIIAYKNEKYNLDKQDFSVPEGLNFDALKAICQRSQNDFERYNACNAYNIYMQSHLKDLYLKWAPRSK